MRFNIILLQLFLLTATISAQTTADLRADVIQGDLEAAIMLSERYSMGTWETEINPDSAIYFLKYASEKGSKDAPYLLGLNYMHGLGVGRDEKKGIEWLELAAERGNKEALNAMYRAYSQQVSMFEDIRLQLQPDYKKALKFATIAAEDGDTEAMLYCGLAHHEGKGTAKDDSLGVVWLDKAAALNYAPAQYQVAWWYFRGLTDFGTDFDKAYTYFEMLARNPSSNIDELTNGKVGMHECVQWKRITANLHWSMALPDPLMSPQLYVKP